MGYVGNVTADNGTANLVASTLYGTCSTAANTAAKEVVCTNFDALLNGVTIHVYFSNTNTAANPTLNVNSTGAKAIYRYGTTAPGDKESTSWKAGATISFTYDQTNTCWRMNDNTEGSAPVFNGTTQEWNQLSTAEKKAFDNANLSDDYDDPAAISAANVTYSNTTSHMSSTNVQGAIDELKNTLNIYTADLIPNSDVVSLNYGLTVSKSGNTKIAKLICEVNAITDTVGWTTLCDIPSGFLPTSKYEMLILVGSTLVSVQLNENSNEILIRPSQAIGTSVIITEIVYF